VKWQHSVKKFLLSWIKMLYQPHPPQPHPPS
jgi:hypothetical protein